MDRFTAEAQRTQRFRREYCESLLGGDCKIATRVFELRKVNRSERKTFASYDFALRHRNSDLVLKLKIRGNPLEERTFIVVTFGVNRYPTRCGLLIDAPGNLIFRAVNTIILNYEQDPLTNCTGNIRIIDLATNHGRVSTRFHAIQLCSYQHAWRGFFSRIVRVKHRNRRRVAERHVARSLAIRQFAGFELNEPDFAVFKCKLEGTAGRIALGVGQNQTW